MATKTRTTRPTVFAALEGQWNELAASTQLRARIRTWAERSPALADYSDGHQLVEDASRDRELLEGVARLAAEDSVAMTATLVALLPRLVYLANIGGNARSTTGETSLDYDDRCAMVVSIAHEVVLRCHPDDGSTSWYDRRLWSNISKRYRRWVEQQRASLNAAAERLGEMSITGTAESISGEVGQRLAAAFTIEPDCFEHDEAALAELCQWVADRASVDLGTARLIVMTRAGGVPIEALVEAEGASAPTIRQRRLRAEQRLATALAAA